MVTISPVNIVFIRLCCCHNMRPSPASVCILCPSKLGFTCIADQAPLEQGSGGLLENFLVSVGAEFTLLRPIRVFEIGISGTCPGASCTDARQLRWKDSEIYDCRMELSKLHLPLMCCMVASGRPTIWRKALAF